MRLPAGWPTCPVLPTASTVGNNRRAGIIFFPSACVVHICKSFWETCSWACLLCFYYRFYIYHIFSLFPGLTDTPAVQNVAFNYYLLILRLLYCPILIKIIIEERYKSAYNIVQDNVFTYKIDPKSEALQQWHMEIKQMSHVPNAKRYRRFLSHKK